MTIYDPSHTVAPPIDKEQRISENNLLQNDSPIVVSLTVTSLLLTARLYIGDNNEDQIHSHTGFTLHHIILYYTQLNLSLALFR